MSTKIFFQTFQNSPNRRQKRQSIVVNIRRLCGLFLNLFCNFARYETDNIYNDVRRDVIILMHRRQEDPET